jgi:hypothetical protein
VRYGQEFGTATADEYGRLADAFMMEPLREGVLECQRRRDGARVRFDPKTNEFGILTIAGHIATFMIVQPLRSSSQTPRQYYEAACK